MSAIFGFLGIVTVTAALVVSFQEKVRSKESLLLWLTVLFINLANMFD